MPDRAEIEAFYNQFSTRRMSTYRASGNKRLSAAMAFVGRNVRSGEAILDIGCGVGLVSENLAKRFPDSRVVGIDIAEENVRRARDEVRLPNVTFMHASVTEQIQEIRSTLGRPADVICMVDVVEHLPEPDRPAVFAGLGDLASRGGKLLLTYPSPEYQRHLMANNRQELQIVDNEIEIECLAGEARMAGWKCRSFSYVDVWLTNQYIHAAFCRELPLDSITAPPRPLFRRGLSFVARKLTRVRSLARAR